MVLTLSKMGNARTIPQTCKGYNVIKCKVHARLIKVGTKTIVSFEELQYIDHIKLGKEKKLPKYKREFCIISTVRNPFDRSGFPYGSRKRITTEGEPLEGSGVSRSFVRIVKFFSALKANLMTYSLRYSYPTARNFSV
jgi:hypothetical protein